MSHHPLDYCEDDFDISVDDITARQYKLNPLATFIPNKWDSDFLKLFPYEELIKSYYIAMDGIYISFKNQEGLLSFIMWYGKPEEMSI